MNRFDVESGMPAVRLDVFLQSRMPEFSRSRLQDRIRSGQVRVNDSPARPSLVLKPGDRIEIDDLEAVVPSEVVAEDIPLSLLYEDEHLLVLNKPAGFVVHPGAGNVAGTVVNALLHHCAGLSSIGGVERPGIVHRLDKETSGCLVVAKNDITHRSLSAQFANREVDKVYIALVQGRLRHPHGEITAAIGRHPVHRQKMAVSDRGREALTRYRLLASDGTESLVECRPKTGRTHQIRVHLKHLGHPVVGDPVYGRRGSHERHMLHAWQLTFLHPARKKRMTFVSPLAPEFPVWAREAVPAA